MHVAITLPAACRVVVPRHADAPIAPRNRTGRQPTCLDAAALRLLFATVSMALGLAAVTASFVPATYESGDSGPSQPRIGVSRAVAPAVPSRTAGQNLAQPLAMPVHLVGAPVPEALPYVSATGPWNSPLYPQNGVTLWDRIRVSSKRDRRAFLFGTAIQLHAPKSAATPGPWPDLRGP